MSEKEDKEGHPTQQITQQQREPNPTTTEPTHCNNWPLPHPLPRREGRNHRDTPNGLLLVVYGVSWSHVNRCSAHFITLFYMP